MDDIEDYREDEGKECADAYVDFGYCYADAYRESCNLFDALDDCDDLYEDYNDACD